MKRLNTVVNAALATLALCTSASAQVVSYTRMPLSNVIARLDQKYGIHIVMKGSLANKPTLPVSFKVGVPGVTTTRLMVIAALADAANVDFQKGFVVSKVPGDQAAPDVPIDTNGWVLFKSKTIPAREAITTVANTDDATVQVSRDVTGDVTFSATTLRASQAAKEIANQTHTVWRAYYALTPASLMAVTPHPFTSFDQAPPPPPPAATPPATTASAPAPGTPATAAIPNATPPATLTQPVPFQYVPSMGYGYGSPYGGYGYGSPYGGYGYGTPFGGGYGYGSPYGGYGGYGSPYGGGVMNILPGTGGYGPFGGYGGPPVTIP